MMNPEEVRSAAGSIWEMRHPTRIKPTDSEARYRDAQFRKRVQEIDSLEADIADKKELREVYAL